MELDEVPCLICGAPIDPGLDRGYAIGDGRFLCNACAVRLGGVWDEARDRWATPPSLEGLPDERRPHP